MKLRLLYEDADCLVVDKPSGLLVHSPEDSNHRISPQRNCMHILRNQMQRQVFPVHRLDRATSGALLFAKSSEAAGQLSRQFQKQEVQKTYYCVIRGWLEHALTVDSPLVVNGEAKDAQTEFDPLAQIEVPVANERYATTRLSLVRAIPRTGRWHQIRRHLSHLSHPIIGDREHGKGSHNSRLAEFLGARDLLLKAYEIRFRAPSNAKILVVRARWEHRWHLLFERFGVCPI